MAQKNSSQKLVAFYEIVTGIFQTILGLGLLVFGDELYGLYISLLGLELINSREYLENILTIFFPFLIQHHIALAILLLGLGLVKTVSGWAIYKDLEWGKLLLVLFLLFLIPTDIFSLVQKFTIYKLLFLFLDCLIILIIVNFKPNKFYLEQKNYLRKLFGLII